MQQMPRKYVANYEQLARKRGYKDPLTYLWERFEAERRRENHEAAIALAAVAFSEAIVVGAVIVGELLILARDSVVQVEGVVSEIHKVITD